MIQSLVAETVSPSKIESMAHVQAPFVFVDVGCGQVTIIASEDKYITLS